MLLQVVSAVVSVANLNLHTLALLGDPCTWPHVEALLGRLPLMLQASTLVMT